MVSESPYSRPRLPAICRAPQRVRHASRTCGGQPLGLAIVLAWKRKRVSAGANKCDAHTTPYLMVPLV